MFPKKFFTNFFSTVCCWECRFNPESILNIQKSPICRALHIVAVSGPDILDKVQRRIFNIIGPELKFRL